MCCVGGEDSSGRNGGKPFLSWGMGFHPWEGRRGGTDWLWLGVEGFLQEAQWAEVYSDPRLGSTRERAWQCLHVRGCLEDDAPELTEALDIKYRTR